MNPAWESIRISVCRRCIDGDNSGVCRLPEEEFCPLEEYFPAVMDVIMAARGRPVEAQVKALRSRICAKCSIGSIESCRMRDTLECALERYMPLIIEKVGSMNVGWARM
ncbi:MAG: hypothetical protein HY563_02600 [Ignavibacteriales bacterium]|jgi:hypothetical protein|nr:hypothetical protein [Ignavibacteriales bacterium]